MSTPREEDRPRHVIAVSGLVTDAAGRILLVRPLDRGWEMPGGCVELGENLLDALEREVEEETGCRVAVGELIGLHSKLTFAEMLVLHFRCRYLGGDPRPSPETPEVGWFSLAEAKDLVSTQPHRDRLRDALEPRPGLVYRVYHHEPYAVVDERRVQSQ